MRVRNKHEKKSDLRKSQRKRSPSKGKNEEEGRTRGGRNLGDEGGKGNPKLILRVFVARGIEKKSN